MARTVGDRIKELCQTEREANAEQLLEFLKCVSQRLVDADRRYERLLVTFVLAWVIIASIGGGLISEGEFGSFKVKSLTSLLMAGPAILGLIWYALICATSASLYLNRAVSSLYHYLLPTVARLDLEYLTMPAHPIAVERTLEHESRTEWLNKLRYPWATWFAALLFIGGAVAIAHSVYIAYTVGNNLILTILSALIAIVLWLRGLSVAYIATEFSGP